MKRTALFIFGLIYSSVLVAQVSVNNFGIPPHGSSILDVGSSDKGVLFPRMTMGELENIMNPAKGLLVYCIDDNNFFVNRGNESIPDWTMVNSKWRANGPHIFYPGGNVGLGVPDPILKLDIRGSFPGEAGSLIVANSDISHKLILTSGHMFDPDPFIQWKQGDSFRFSTDEGGGTERMRITSIGQVGIGTPFPSANLHITETPFTYTGIFGTPISTWDYGTNVSIGDDNNSSVMYIGQSDTSKGYLIWHHGETPSDAFLSLGTFGNESSLVLQEAGGKIGIGTTDPSYLLDIHHDANSYTAFGKSNIYCQYIFHLEEPEDGTGQTALYAERYSGNGNEGSGYQSYAINSAIKGYVYCDGGPDQYSFALAGYNPDDYNRCGGIIGARNDGYVWGSLGYRSSGGTYYGGYFTSSADGSGKSAASLYSGIGIGAWGGLLGADIHGKVYGTYTEGENYALFTNGVVYNNNLEVNLQDNGTDTKTVLYTNTATDVTVQTSGVATLNNGKATVAFDKAFVSSISRDVPVIVFAMPAGKSNGVYLEEVSSDGFIVAENNEGKSNVLINYIAIGRRAGYEKPVLSPEVIDAGYIGKIATGLHNDADTDTDGQGIYYEDKKLTNGVHPSLNQKSLPLTNAERPHSDQHNMHEASDAKLTGR